MAREIVLIGAVGKSGQLGLNGGLPWGDAFPEDQRRFRDVTTNCCVLVGHNTWKTMSHLDNTHGRTFLLDSRGPQPSQDVLNYVLSLPGTVFIAGGAKTYRRWLPHVTRFDITMLDYDGPCDTWMPTLFPSTTSMTLRLPKSVPDNRRAWLQAQIAELTRMIEERGDGRDPIGARQFRSKREQYEAELFAMTGDNPDISGG